MSRYHSYIKTAHDLLQQYGGQAPFHLVLKDFFKQHRQFGSRDRKRVTALCYAFFRAGHALNRAINPENMAIAYLLSDDPDPALLDTLKPGWGGMAALPLAERLNRISDRFDTRRLFPWLELLSSEIPTELFAASLLTQPGFFARVRPARRDQVLKKAATIQPPPEQPETGCLRFPSGFDLQTVFQPDYDLVIQDLQSQHTLDALLQHRELLTKNGRAPRIWDCCAASGGKSILAFDLLEGKPELTVTDIRATILRNLSARFERAGISHYQSAVCDLAHPAPALPGEPFDCIICDAPCTGSGTWGRTPEQLFFFNPAVLPGFTSRQLTIARHALPKLREGGLFFYITCSLFSSENEAVVGKLLQESKLELLHQQYLCGIELGSDSLFTAVLRKTG